MPHFLRLLKCPKLPPARNATEKAHRFRTVGDKNWKSLWCAYAKVPLLARSQTPVATIVFASKKSILASNIRTAAKTAPMPPCVIVPITIFPLNWEPFRRTKAWNRLLGMEEWEKGEAKFLEPNDSLDFIIDRMLISRIEREMKEIYNSRFSFESD